MVYIIEDMAGTLPKHCPRFLFDRLNLEKQQTIPIKIEKASGGNCGSSENCFILHFLLAVGEISSYFPRILQSSEYCAILERINHPDPEKSRQCDEIIYIPAYNKETYSTFTILDD